MLRSRKACWMAERSISKRLFYTSGGGAGFDSGRDGASRHQRLTQAELRFRRDLAILRDPSVGSIAVQCPADPAAPEAAETVDASFVSLRFRAMVARLPSGTTAGSEP